ncbi:uncharacterized protein LOC108220662 isoform X1 [Daucus carota subsp. sativus]|uniref:uncharacterized protein LOC108220662 isoform X1 n=1 Tax=Daucus carota subsp. sativus TaxID=79200 RepID=UPI0007F0252B|nr:PREDICTED: uncharacterized protein LOC108220662 isoform X1 [Daucus carota subsp. sativus]XP_017249979.1 PREDICTED: uncharacterized protein LOC108220662 isoform X1 [Daucus carota subsp. sativus]XP_017249980.1 PREDICTED: uncharacterized protein LOC108220662 isoform X1 [Daucus carota subsp. sativus]
MWFDMYFCKNYRQKVLRAISRIKIFTICIHSDLSILNKDWFSRNEIDSFCEILLSLDSETGLINISKFLRSKESNEFPLIKEITLTGTCNNTCSESSAASDSGVQIIDDLHTGMEVGYPVKVDNGDNNETEMDKDDDEKQEQKDTGNGLEKDDENKSPKAELVARNTDSSESPAADKEEYRKTDKKCDAPVGLNKKSSKKSGRKGSNQKTVQKPRRVWNTSPSSDSDTLEPPLKRCTGKDCGNKAKKEVNASLDTNGRNLDESTSMPTEEPIQKEISASSGISLFVDFTQYGPLPFIRRP